MSDLVDHIQLGQPLFALTEEPRLLHRHSELVRQCREKLYVVIAKRMRL